MKFIGKRAVTIKVKRKLPQQKFKKTTKKQKNAEQGLRAAKFNVMEN